MRTVSAAGNHWQQCRNRMQVSVAGALGGRGWEVRVEKVGGVGWDQEGEVSRHLVDVERTLEMRLI